MGKDERRNVSVRNRRESKGKKRKRRNRKGGKEMEGGEEEEGERRKERAMKRKGTRENELICDEVTFSYPGLKSWRWRAIFPLLFGAVAHNL